MSDIFSVKEETPAAYALKFKKPFEYDGQSYTELAFNWDALTGEDSLAIEAELQAMGKFIVSPAFSGEYLVRMAAKACTIPIGQDLLRALPISDYNRIRSAARSFLLSTEQ